MIGVSEATAATRISHLLGKAAASQDPAGAVDYLWPRPPAGPPSPTKTSPARLRARARIPGPPRRREALTSSTAPSALAGLAAALGNLQDMVASDEDAIAIAGSAPRCRREARNPPPVRGSSNCNGAAIGNRESHPPVELYERAGQFDS